MSNHSVDQASGQKPGRRLPPRLKRALLIAAVVLGAGGVAIQFVPVKGIGVNPKSATP
jgi:hypothetical protein